MSRHRLTIRPEGAAVDIEAGTNLADALREAGYPVSLYCHKRGVCGKCLVEIESGDAGLPDPSETAVLARRGASAAARLACRISVQGPLTIAVPEASLVPAISDVPALSEGFRRPVSLDPPLRKYAVRPPAASLQDPGSDLDRLLSLLPDPALEASLAAMRGLAASSPADESRVLTAVVHGRSLLDVEPEDTSARQLGLAVDLGTTTVAAELVDLETGRTIAAEAALNGQVRFGADVVTRVTAAHADFGQAKGLRRAAWETINALLLRLLEQSGREASEVYETVVAGNTAMAHLALGLPVDGLAVAPFQSLFSVLPAFPAGPVGSAANPEGRVYFAPAIKSFVGGDIAAGLAAVDIESGPDEVLFLDLGTNGEIVLKHGCRLTCTSTAAGPAFEGMSLSCGMIAGPGAVHAAAFRDGRLDLRVIGGRPAAGICGSGLIDILAVALDQGWIDASGAVLAPGRTIPVAPGIALSQKDVREVQLAAAAVKTGLHMLLAEAGLATGDLDGVCVAGAFGSTLDVRNASRLGLIPEVDPARIRFVGNTSLAGARILLLSAGERARCESLAGRIRHVSLARGEDFQSQFVESLEFKPWR
ncbi:MAG: ASKHA domain-containing protein [Candidatus Aminicenantes bacterium]|nr:ASKHA domain-containing protein [Candidatus Aminicenantes bacterium]